MNEKIIKPGMVKKVVDKLEGTRINVGGNKEFYKSEYHLQYTQEIVDNVISAFLETITEVIENGDSVRLNGYMLIEPKYYVKRKARNVIEDKGMILPEQYRVKVSIGSKLKKACKRFSDRELGRQN